MTVKNTGDLLSSINADLANNNAGLISAEDVRHNMADAVESINLIVSSGDFDTSWAFVNDVRAQRNSITNTGGMFIPESGINFVNGGGIQYEPFKGVSNIDHDSLGGLPGTDPHTQYILADGSRAFTGNVSVKDNVVSASGTSVRGVSFKYINDNREDIHIKGSGQLVFEMDSGRIPSAKAGAKAWIAFNTSGNVSPTNWAPVIYDSFNITKFERLQAGKFRLTFTSGVLGDNYYVALGSARFRHGGSSANTASDGSDFSQGFIGVAKRSGSDDTASDPRQLTFNVLAEDNTYVESDQCDLVIFGRGSGVLDSPTPETPTPSYG
jgi:hypothetical protein